MPLGVFLSPSVFFDVIEFFPIEHLNVKSSNINLLLLIILIKLFLANMFNSQLVIYNHPILYKILLEINTDLNTNFDLTYIKNLNDINKYIKEKSSYIILTNKNNNLDNELIIENFPIKISYLIEKINIEILKNNYDFKSNIIIGKYSLNLNSKEILFNQLKLKLTEQEIKLLSYLSKMNNPVNVHHLQKNIWGYKIDIDTHTVETHIHRLRKKFLIKFGDKELIKSNENGYFIY